MFDLPLWTEILLIYVAVSMMHLPFWWAFLYRVDNDEEETIAEFILGCGMAIYWWVPFVLVWPVWWAIAVLGDLLNRRVSIHYWIGTALGNKKSLTWMKKNNLF